MQPGSDDRAVECELFAERLGTKDTLDNSIRHRILTLPQLYNREES